MDLLFVMKMPPKSLHHLISAPKKCPEKVLLIGQIYSKVFYGRVPLTFLLDKSVLILTFKSNLKLPINCWHLVIILYKKLYSILTLEWHLTMYCFYLTLYLPSSSIVAHSVSLGKLNWIYFEYCAQVLLYSYVFDFMIGDPLF